MFPIRDHNPSERTPYVTFLLIVANVAVFLVMLPMFSDPSALHHFWETWALVPRDVTRNREFSGLVTSLFLHGGFFHLVGNMLFLWIFGDNLEDTLGHGRFLLFYLACGIAAGLAHVVSVPVSTVPTIGASGAVAGVLGGYLLLFPRARIDVVLFLIILFRIIPFPAWVVLGFWFGGQLLAGLATPAAGAGIAYWAHVGGFMFGALLVLPVWLRRRGTDFRGRRGDTSAPAQQDRGLTESEIPTVRRRTGRSHRIR